MIRLISIAILLMISSQALGRIKVKEIGTLPKSLIESSGLEFYKGKYILTINDSGNSPHVFVIDKTAKIKRKIKIKNAENVDWEDMTSAPDGRVFIGDIGNNLNKRKSCQIYILDNDFLKDKDDDVKAKKIEFSYEDQTKFPPSIKERYYDAEAMFWMKDSIYILTKCRTEPFTGRSFIYVIPDKPGTYKARKLGEIPFCSLGWMFCSVTSADYDKKSNTIAVLLYGKLALIHGFKGNKFWEGELDYYNIPRIKQREAITYVNSNTWLMTDELNEKMGGGKMYSLQKK